MDNDIAHLINALDCKETFYLRQSVSSILFFLFSVTQLDGNNSQHSSTSEGKLKGSINLSSESPSPSSVKDEDNPLVIKPTTMADSEDPAGPICLVCSIS